MKPHFFNSNYPIFIIRFLATIKLACNTICIHLRSGNVVSLILCKALFCNAVKQSHVRSHTHCGSSPIEKHRRTDNTVEKFSHLSASSKQLNQEDCKRWGDQRNGLLNSALYKTDQHNFHAIRWRLHANSRKTADVLDKSALNDIFIEDVDFYICHSLWKYCATHPHEDVTEIAFNTQSQLAIQKIPWSQHPLSTTQHSQNSLCNASELSRLQTLLNANHRHHRRVTPVLNQSIAYQSRARWWLWTPPHTSSPGQALLPHLWHFCRKPSMPAKCASTSYIKH